MNIDKNLLLQLANLDDNALLCAVRMFASKGGISLGEIDKGSLEKLRSALRGASDDDIANAKRIFEEYKGQ